MAEFSKAVRVVDWSTAYACLAFKLGIYLAGAFTTTPLQRIFEANICRDYYREHDPSVIDAYDYVVEELCKVAPVQKRVSDINGHSSGLDLLPGKCVLARGGPKIKNASLLTTL